MKAYNFLKQIIFLGLGLSLLVACNDSKPIHTSPVPSPQESPTPELEITATSQVPYPPTIDPGTPLAVSVNGQGITLAEYQAELERARSASEAGLRTYTEKDVLQNLIDEVLLAQGATEAGFIPDEAFLQTRLDQLGLDEQSIQDWMAFNGYTQDSFERAFARSIAAAWMRDQIIAAVPSTAEQVHARQILLYNSDEAKNAYDQLQAGTDFATLANQYDPLSSGELGWFPRGYLTVPELDDPIFSLQNGEFTPIIETILGYHIVQVIERDPQHPLSPGAFQTFQVQAVQNWLVERRSQSDIQIFLS